MNPTRQGSLCALTFTIATILFLVLNDAPSARANRPADLANCSGPLTRELCHEASHGEIVVGRAERVPGAAGASVGGRATGGVGGRTDGPPAWMIRQVNSFCADAIANAGMNGAPLTPPIVALCRPSPPGATVPAVPATPTPELVLQALRRLPLPAARLHTDPAGWTLVNLPTEIWATDATVGIRTVDLLGTPVRVRPRPVTYTWTFADTAADGATIVATDRTAGPRTDHTWRRAGASALGATVTWAADYALPDGVWRPVTGSTTTVSSSLDLPVRQARAVLVHDPQ